MQLVVAKRALNRSRICRSYTAGYDALTGTATRDNVSQHVSLTCGQEASSWEVTTAERTHEKMLKHPLMSTYLTQLSYSYLAALEQET